MADFAYSKPLVLLLLFAFILSTLGCTSKSAEMKKYGPDADYFIGLRLLQDGQEKEAKAKFNRVIKKGSYYTAKKSAQMICTLGSVQEKNQSVLKLLEKFNDQESLLIAVKQLESSGELTKIIQITDELDLQNDDNEIIKIRMKALKSQNSTSYENEVFTWFISRPLTQDHYQFYKENFLEKELEPSSESQESENHQNEYSPKEFAINYRVESYKKNYNYTFLHSGQILDYFMEGSLTPCPQLASDLGKSYLYGNSEFLKNAEYLKTKAEKFINNDIEFYLWFYTGRLYEKASNFRKSKEAFEKALSASKDSSQKDNALWYILNNSIPYSIDSIVENIDFYAKSWADPHYFDDFFESLISSLLAAGRWNNFYDIYTKIDGYASDETVAQFAYIYARLAEEGFAKGSKEDIQQAYYRTLNADSSVYYKVMASYRLGLEGQKLQEILSQSYEMDKWKKPSEGALKNQASEEKQKAAKILLEGYADFGFPKMIYPAWQKLYKEGLPVETYFYLAEFLQKTGKADDNQDFYAQALRIASRGQKYADRMLTTDELKLVYPKNYCDLVEKYSQKYGLNPNVMYALIRSESFFDPDIKSMAGATGLTQLMEFTGSDIARKLKIKEYSLTDPKTSIEFGTFYLEELIRRCDDNTLLGFFSYNAGITRVRRWLKSSLIEFGKKSDMPLDLFLETIPYSETREYGRKLVSATAMYEYLSNPQNFTSIVKTLMKE